MVVAHLPVLSNSTCIPAQHDSMAALSKQPPGAERAEQASSPHVFPEAPGRELGAVVGVQNHCATPCSLFAAMLTALLTSTVSAVVETTRSPRSTSLLAAL